MANFESPIGNKKISGRPMRNLEVPNEDYDQQENYVDESSLRRFQSQIDRFDSQAEREIYEAKEAKRTGKQKISEGAKKRIEILLGMTQTTREVTIENNLFILKSLKSKDMRESLMVAAEYDGTVQGPYELRRQILARSLTHVAGIEFEQFIASNSLEDKLLFLDELDESLLSRLYDEYVLLGKEIKEKYSVKDDKDVEEVFDNLKKS